MSNLPATIPFRHPDQPAPEEPSSESITMREAFDCYKLEELVRKRESTRQRYRNAIDHWEHHTSNPPLADVTKHTIVRFQNRCLEEASPKSGKPLGPVSVDTTCTHLAGVMRSVGPAGERLLDRLPKWPKVARAGKKKAKMFLEPDVRVAFYQACRVATRPRGAIPAPLFWRTLMAFLESYGWRPSDLCHGKPEWFTGVSWAQVDLEERVIRAEMQKTGRGEDQDDDPFAVPITPPVAVHLEEFARFRSTGYLFEIDEQAFYRQWDRIRKQADAEGTPYDWRETTNTVWQMACGPGAGVEWLGHRPQSVNGRHYTATQRLLWQQLVEREFLPEFCSPANSPRQQTLF